MDIIEGDCVERMRELDEASVDAIVTDPPYGLEFMGKEWDKFSGAGFAENNGYANRGTPSWSRKRWQNKRCSKCGHIQSGGSPCQCPEPDWIIEQGMAQTNKAMLDFQSWSYAWATEALRVLKPGGHLLAFGGTRTYHRLACAIEDAGFEIRDSLIWLYGSGFPKSLDVSKAIDKRAEENVETKRRIAAVAAVITEYREKAGMERGEVSEAVVGTPSGACWNWEHQQLPSVEMWPKIKTTLSIPDDFDPLIEGDRSQFIAAAREVLGRLDRPPGWFTSGDGHDLTAPATPEAAQWEGWGSALKPGHEPIVMARKPLIGTVAQTVTQFGTGALNIGATRIDWEGDPPEIGTPGWGGPNKTLSVAPTVSGETVERTPPSSLGRWPANVALSHLSTCGVSACPTCGSKGNREVHDRYREKRKDHLPVCPDVWHLATKNGHNIGCAPGCPIAELDEQSGERKAGSPKSGNEPLAAAYSGNLYGEAARDGASFEGYQDSGGASRFFYTAKASRGERNAGLDGFEERERDGSNWVRTCRVCGDNFTDVKTGKPKCGHDDVGWETARPTKNGHPTVKPIDLMRWLVRLVTPPGGTICDPFAGSGTTGIAAVMEGFDFIGIEREAEYVAIAEARIAWWRQHAGRDTEDVLLEAGFSERDQRERSEAGQLGLLVVQSGSLRHLRR